MEELATADIDAPARLLQLRLHVLSAQVKLKAGYMFADETTTADLLVPSGAQSGIKINLRDADGNADGAGVDLAPGETILVVVDMDVDQNFVVNGSPDDPDGAPGGAVHAVAAGHAGRRGGQHFRDRYVREPARAAGRFH